MSVQRSKTWCASTAQTGASIDTYYYSLVRPSTRDSFVCMCEFQNVCVDLFPPNVIPFCFGARNFARVHAPFDSVRVLY